MTKLKINQLKINRIKRLEIFQNDFEDLKSNNIIDFTNSKICVLYAPNGVGKTSFCKVLSGEEGEFDIENIGEENNTKIINENIHVIHDQNRRNIIKGTAREFLLGDNIRREYELKDLIDKEFANIFQNKIDKLKDFGIVKTNDKKIEIITNEKIKKYTKALASNKNKGTSIEKKDFVNTVKNLKIDNTLAYDDEKLKYFIENYEDIIIPLDDIKTISQVSEVSKMEENIDAVKLLQKYITKEECVVCDNEIDTNNLLKKKNDSTKKIKEFLGKDLKRILENIINNVTNNDPFEIKNTLIKAIRDGNIELIEILKAEVKKYKNIFNNNIEKIFYNSINNDVEKNIEEYNTIITNQPEFTDEDLLYIKHIIVNNIGKSIEIKRNTNSTPNIELGGKIFLEVDRDKLELSNGEQNFISLTFELLKAKNSESEIIVIDDPISSFDSIYKNKLAYCLVKFLENKKQIILTHNTDVLRLLELQWPGKINLYLFNNFERQVNGFIHVNNEEKDMLIYIPKLIEKIRNTNETLVPVNNKKKYLISLIPFMRGYASITGEYNEKDELSKCMHGYCDEKVDITGIFNKMFRQNISEECKISAKDIIDNINIDKEEQIIDKDKFPLLNKTLYHSYIYLYLRLKVEQKLVQKYKINTNKYSMLNGIIQEAFKDLKNDSDETKNNKIRSKVLLTSKKTLLNEFNHFDGNMSIYQPAIDISDNILEKEKKEILDFLGKL